MPHFLEPRRAGLGSNPEHMKAPPQPYRFPLTLLGSYTFTRIAFPPPCLRESRGRFRIGQELTCETFGWRTNLSEVNSGDDVSPCDNCVGLVGAGPGIGPHSHLRPARQQDEDARKEVLVCTQCGILWRKGPLGWGRMVRAS